MNAELQRRTEHERDRALMALANLQRVAGAAMARIMRGQPPNDLGEIQQLGPQADAACGRLAVLMSLSNDSTP